MSCRSREITRNNFLDFLLKVMGISIVNYYYTFKFRASPKLIVLCKKKIVMELIDPSQKFPTSERTSNFYTPPNPSSHITTLFYPPPQPPNPDREAMYHLNTTSVFAVPSPSVSEPTYIYDIIPISNGLIGALSSDDCLRIVDPVDLRRGAVSVVKAVGKDVTALKVVSEDVIAAAGRDGVLGLWDWRNGGKAGEVRSRKLVIHSFLYINFWLGDRILA